MVTKKQLLKQIEKLKNDVETKTTDFVTLKDLQRQLQVTTAKLQAAILNNKDNENNLTIYDQIANNQIPQGWHWKYWIFINQLAYYWNGRYENYETNRNKREIELTKYIAIMYGLAGYHKIEDRAYYIAEIKNNKCLCFPIDNMLNWNNENFIFTSNGKTNSIKINVTGLEGKWFDKKDIALCQWQTNNLGIFIWYLQDALYYLLTKQIVISNAAVLTNPIYFEVNNLETIKTKEFNNILDPLKPIKYLVKNDINIDNNMLGKTSINLIDNQKRVVDFGNTLILTTKFIQENFFTIFGIPITSAKNQSLSADANLSISLCNNIAKEHDKFMKLFFKDLEINLEIEDNEFNYLVQNENADKAGTGLNKNTDGDNIKND